MVATDYVARSAKDGYTLMFATIATTINMTLMAGKAPNVEKDMTPVALVGSIPNILVVNPQLGVSDVKGLIALAKQKPDELLYGASGLGSGPHVATELFKQMAGVKMTGVLYPGSGQTAVDLIAGRIQVMFAPAPTVLGLIKDGRVKALATTEAKRSSVAPDLPTIAEAGLPGYAAGLWFGILGPGGLPQPVVDTLSKATNAALKDPAVLNELQRPGPQCRRRQPGRLRPTSSRAKPSAGPKSSSPWTRRKKRKLPPNPDRSAIVRAARGHRRPRR